MADSRSAAKAGDDLAPSVNQTPYTWLTMIRNMQGTISTLNARAALIPPGQRHIRLMGNGGLGSRDCLRRGRSDSGMIATTAQARMVG